MEILRENERRKATKDKEKRLHIISKQPGRNKPHGLYAPESCPCSFGICSECINSAVGS